MPTDFQSLVVYIIVALTLGFVLRGALRRRRGTACGRSCGCAKNEIKRDPVIERLVRQNEDRP